MKDDSLTGTKGTILKVIELGIQDKVYEAMKQPKFSVEALTRSLNAQGIKITAQSIRKFIKKTKTAQRELISKDLQTANEIKSLTMNYSKALKDILHEVEEVKNTSLQEKDMATYNQLVGRIYQGIELIAKLTGDIKPKGSTTVDINIIYNEITENIEDKMRKVNTDIKTGKIIDVDAEIIQEDKLQEEKTQQG